MTKNKTYFEYEDKVTASRLKWDSKIQTFKTGLELSEVALKLLFASFRDQYKNYSQKTILNKFRSFLRTI